MKPARLRLVAGNGDQAESRQAPNDGIFPITSASHAHSGTAGRAVGHAMRDKRNPTAGFGGFAPADQSALVRARANSPSRETKAGAS